MKNSGLAYLLLWVFISTVVSIQRKAFSLEDFGEWNQIEQVIISSDDKILLYVASRMDLKLDKSIRSIWRIEGNKSGEKLIDNSYNNWNPSFSSDGVWIYFLSDASGDSQLWRVRRDGGNQTLATQFNGGISKYSISQSDPKKVVFLSQIGKNVPDKDTGVLPPMVINRFQAVRDGDGFLYGNLSTQIFSMDLESKVQSRLTSGSFDNWCPTYSPDGKLVSFLSKRRGKFPDRTYFIDVYVMDIDGNNVRQVNSRGVDGGPDLGEPECPIWSSDSRFLVWVTSRSNKCLQCTPSGLTLLDLSNGSERQLADVDAMIKKIAWERDGKSLMGIMYGDRESKLVRISLEDSKKVEILIGGDGTTPAFAIKSNGFVYLKNDQSRSDIYEHPEGRNLTFSNPWILERSMGTNRDVSFSSDGQEIHGLMIIPWNRKEGERLPLVIRAHGGPSWQFTKEFQLEWQIYASNGYAVLGINPRGSSGRGFEWENAIAKKWEDLDVKDVMKGIDWAISKGYADPEKIVMGGWSYGGFLTNYMIASDSRIKAAVSGAATGNILGMYGVDQYASTYDSDFGPPWKDLEVYTRISFPFLKANRISTPTIFMCGGSDYNVPCSGSQQMYQALQNLNISTQLVVYPYQHHHLSIPSYSLDVISRSLDWFSVHISGKTLPIPKTDFQTESVDKGKLLIVFIVLSVVFFATTLVLSFFLWRASKKDNQKEGATITNPLIQDYD